MAKTQKVQGGTQEGVSTDDFMRAELDKTEANKIQLAQLEAELALSAGDIELEGLEDVVIDVGGYWDPERSVIAGIVLPSAKLIETDMGVTAIWAVQLLKPCAGRKGSSQESEPAVFPAGTILGVFHSFSLGALKNMAGATVVIERHKDKMTLSDGAREMWTYRIRANKTRGKVTIIDNRSVEAPF